MFCPKCGNSLPDDAAFCGACGTQLASATPVQKPKVQVKKSWIAIGAAVLVVALVVVLCVTLIGGNSAKGVLEKYLDENGRPLNKERNRQKKGIDWRTLI